jgi:hypothetical protein
MEAGEIEAIQSHTPLIVSTVGSRPEDVWRESRGWKNSAG